MDKKQINDFKEFTEKELGFQGSKCGGNCNQCGGSCGGCTGCSH